jgi:hypothetical protein
VLGSDFVEHPAAAAAGEPAAAPAAAAAVPAQPEAPASA